MINTKNNGSSSSGESAHVLGNVPPPEFHPDWFNLNEPDHFVQFYESDDFLLSSLDGFIGGGLETGDACVVVATKAHRDDLECRLRASGRDLQTARSSDQYMTLDAAETLSKFMIDGTPDPKLFTEVIGNVIKRAAGRGRRVRIFGEMVALLFAEQRGPAAIELEALWNNLADIYPFTLFCAYQINQFKGDSFTEPFKHVCDRHARVLPAESYAALTDAKDQLRTITLLQQQANSLAAEIQERKRTEEELLALKDKLEVQLSEREQLLRREQSARSEAESASRLKDEFLATLSHELRTPLNAILGWSRMLLTEGLDEATKTQAITTINRNAGSQVRLVQDILDVSKMITGKLRLDIGPVDLVSLIEHAVDTVQLSLKSKEINLKLFLDPSVRYISGDADRLRQVIWNLLSNAVKFTPAGGDIVVRLERAGDSALNLEVSDSGQGICQDFLPYIFDRFRQADGSSTRRHGGLGLGLAIVRHLVELHGGTVCAESSGPGTGAKFIVRLPLIIV